MPTFLGDLVKLLLGGIQIIDYRFSLYGTTEHIHSRPTKVQLAEGMSSEDAVKLIKQSIRSSMNKWPRLSYILCL